MRASLPALYREAALTMSICRRTPATLSRPDVVGSWPSTIQV